jgi:hypothetical protein
VRAHNFSGLFIGLVRGTPIIWQSAARLSPFPFSLALLLRAIQRSQETQTESRHLNYRSLVSSHQCCIELSPRLWPTMTTADMPSESELREFECGPRGGAVLEMRKVNHLVPWLPWVRELEIKPRLPQLKQAVISLIFFFHVINYRGNKHIFYQFMVFLFVHVSPHNEP